MFPSSSSTVTGIQLKQVIYAKQISISFLLLDDCLDDNTFISDTVHRIVVSRRPFALSRRLPGPFTNGNSNILIILYVFGLNFNIWTIKEIPNFKDQPNMTKLTSGPPKILF